MRLTITGQDLSPTSVLAVARQFAEVQIDDCTLDRVARARAVIEHALADGTPVYGVTTGLGSRVIERLDLAEASQFSVRTLRGRAMSVGEPLSTEVVRAAMVVRLNGLCAGRSGANPAVPEAIAKLLNARVHPVIRRSGSTGAADICLLAHLGLTLIGEGEAELEGDWLDSATALAGAGLHSLELGSRDGLAICSSSAVSVGAAALALVDARELLAAAQVAAALSMEGFRANPSPLDPRVVAARSAPGQAWAAAGLRRLLAGGSLLEPGGARRLQDPISFRATSQVHGALYTALGWLSDALAPDLNGAGDNPVIVDDEVVPTGNFHTPALALALDAAAIALTQTASIGAERASRLASQRLSELPRNLTKLGPSRSGVAPLLKTAQSLVVETAHLAAPLAIHSRIGADGVEDHSTNSVQAALRVTEQLERVRRVIALELVCAAQAVDLAQPPRLGAGTAAAHECVRELVAPLEDDRPLGIDVEAVSQHALANRRLSARIDAALAEATV